MMNTRRTTMIMATVAAAATNTAASASFQRTTCRILARSYSQFPCCMLQEEPSTVASRKKPPLSVNRVLVGGASAYQSRVSLFSATSSEAENALDGGSISDAERQMTLDARCMVDAAIRAVDPISAVRAHLHLRDKETDGGRILTVLGNDNDGNPASRSTSYDLSNYDRIVLVAFGKASAAMACAVVEEMSPHCHENQKQLLEGLIICKDGHVSPQELDMLEKHNISVHEASHPVPDERSVAASQRLLDLVKTRTSLSNSKTLLLACISGGGSALFCSPRPPLTLQDLQYTNTALLQSGWRIQDMNVVRQCLDLGKGGGLAQLAGDSTTVVSLILSDIIGDPLDLIASGPTVVTPKSQQKFTTAWNLVQQDADLRAQLPLAVLDVLSKGYEQEQRQQQFVLSTSIGESQVSAKEHKHHHCLIGNNSRAVQAAAKQAEALGYHPIVLTTQLQGEASTVAQVLVGLAQHLRKGPLPFSLASPNQFPVALIAGGETTVTLPSGSSFDGKGGRNQELALAAALALQSLQLRQVVMASVGTDGNDGPTDAAGAIVDGGTVRRLSLVGKNNDDDSVMSAEQVLRQHNAYPYLDRCDCEGVSPLVKTGPTGTNVADICVVLVYEREQDLL